MHLNYSVAQLTICLLTLESKALFRLGAHARVLCPGSEKDVVPVSGFSLFTLGYSIYKLYIGT